MIKTKIPIYLASKSPRRKSLLQQLNLQFRILSVDCNENIKKGERPVDTVRRIADQKMAAAKLLVKKGIIITADTIVVIDGKTIGKPANKKGAFNILKKLSGRTHIVYTGFSVFNTVLDKQITSYEKTFVTFRKINDKEIIGYVSKGSPMDKAGAYGIQDDYGAVFVKKINGCYNNVVGLPLTKLYDSLLKVI